MVYSVNKFCHYLLGNQFVFHVDHQALLCLINKPNLVGKLARWILLLQEFDFTIQHTPGSQHAIADFLSRINSGEPANGGVPDQLLDADLFAVEEEVIVLDWYDEMMGFLTHGTFSILHVERSPKTSGSPE